MENRKEATASYFTQIRKHHMTSILKAIAVAMLWAAFWSLYPVVWVWIRICNAMVVLKEPNVSREWGEL
jgi:hypothetical protein